MNQLGAGVVYSPIIFYLIYFKGYIYRQVQQNDAARIILRKDLCQQFVIGT